MTVHCPRKRSDMTPCVITDGAICYAFNSEADTRPVCVGCGAPPTLTGVKPPADWEQQVREALRKGGRRR